MARTLNPETHAIRREAFVEVAERLMQAKGYEQLSVQEILSELGASKGAFYHYFDSKAALLDAVVERMAEAATAILTPMVNDPDLTAVAKLESVFRDIARWKGEHTELLLALLEVWLADENAIVREKFRRGIARRLTPLLASIVEQGQLEGVFTSRSPAHVARVLVSLIQGANETAVELYFGRRANATSFEVAEDTLAAYEEAFERILGLPVATFTVVDRATLRQWLG